MKYKTLCLASLCLFLTMTDANASMKELFDKGMFNFNSAGSLSNKKGWSGGGASFRAELVAPNIVSLKLPTWNAGCGGIDFFGGSFSMINSDEINQALRGIMQGASSYAFSLALGSVCPSCKDLAMSLQKRMQQINDMARTSCQAAAGAMSNWKDKKFPDTEKDETDGSIVKKTADWIYEAGASDDWSWAAYNNDGSSNEAKAQQSGNTFLGSVSHKFFVDADIKSWNFVLSTDIELTQVMFSLLGSLDRYETGATDTEGNPVTDEKIRSATLSLEEFFKGPKKGNNGKIKLLKCLNPTADKKIACVGNNLITVFKDWDGIIGIMIEKYKLVLGEIRDQAVEHSDPALANTLEKLSISNEMQLFLTKTGYDVDSLAEILGRVASVVMIKEIAHDLRTAGKEINENPNISKDTKTQRDKFHALVSTLERDTQTFRDDLYKDLKIKVAMIQVADLLKNSNNP